MGAIISLFFMFVKVLFEMCLSSEASLTTIYIASIRLLTSVASDVCLEVAFFSEGAVAPWELTLVRLFSFLKME